MSYISPETQNANLHRQTTVCPVDLPMKGPWNDEAMPYANANIRGRAGRHSKWRFGTGQGSRVGEEGHGWGELGSEGQMLRKAAREPWDLITPRSLWASRAKTQSGRAGLTSSTMAVCSAAFFFFLVFFSVVFFEGMWPGPYAYQPPELSIKPSVSDGVLQRNGTKRVCVCYVCVCVCVYTYRPEI